MSINEINWKKSDIDTSQSGQVVISDKKFADIVKQDPSQVVSIIKDKITPVDVKNIRIDANGRVIIADEKFRLEIEKSVSTMAEVDSMLNIGCGLGC